MKNKIYKPLSFFVFNSLIYTIVLKLLSIINKEFIGKPILKTALILSVISLISYYIYELINRKEKKKEIERSNQKFEKLLRNKQITEVDKKILEYLINSWLMNNFIYSYKKLFIMLISNFILLMPLFSINVSIKLSILMFILDLFIYKLLFYNIYRILKENSNFKKFYTYIMLNAAADLYLEDKNDLIKKRKIYIKILSKRFNYYTKKELDDVFDMMT